MHAATSSCVKSGISSKTCLGESPIAKKIHNISHSIFNSPPRFKFCHLVADTPGKSHAAANSIVMLRNHQDWEAFEKERIRREKIDLEANMKLYDEMALEARAFGAFPPKDPLESIEYKIRLARILNALPKRP